LQYTDPSGLQQTPRLFESWAGIEIRGQSTRNYEKKQYGLELWANQFEEDRSASLLGMRYGEDWILDAMWTDPLRMRNKLSFEIWEKLAALPEEDRMADVYPGIHLEYVELFINNRYQGIYCLGERFDERILRYAPNQYEQGGVLYEAIHKAEGSTRFEIYDSEPGNSLVWDGWEMVYPDQSLYWNPLAELRKTIVLKNEEQFSASIGSMINLDNVADHYILINLLLAYDNIGKNNFYARYSSNSRFFIIPWDLDYTWGRRWEMLDSGPKGMTGNQLHYRLLENEALDFHELVADRWNTYRKSIFQLDSLLAHVDQHYNELKNSGVIERENKRWADADIDLEYEYAYICNWIEQRLLILDEKLNEEPG
jgi:spore coat protein CotH